MIPHRLEGVTSLREPRSADFRHRLERYQRAVRPADLNALAMRLNVSVHALRRLGIGRVGRAWTFPMVDGRHRVCGFMRLFPSGEQALAVGSTPGLFRPTGIRPGAPLVICTGVLDTAVMLTLGLQAIGRPASIDDDRLLRPYCRARGVALVSNESRREDAARLARELVPTCESARVFTLPTGFPSVHEWMQRGARRSDVVGLIRSAAPMVASEADGGRLVA